jgi:hypothetical protein
MGAPVCVVCGGAQGDNSNALAKLEAKLKQRDAVLEPKILESLRRYVMQGGKPQTVVEVLSENYVGAAAREATAAPLPPPPLYREQHSRAPAVSWLLLVCRFSF